MGRKDFIARLSLPYSTPPGRVYVHKSYEDYTDSMDKSSLYYAKEFYSRVWKEKKIVDNNYLDFFIGIISIDQGMFQTVNFFEHYLYSKGKWPNDYTVFNREIQEIPGTNPGDSELMEFINPSIYDDFFWILNKEKEYRNYCFDLSEYIENAPFGAIGEILTLEMLKGD